LRNSPPSAAPNWWGRDYWFKEFLKLDKKVDILGFIREGYGVFHLMGDEGILNEIEDYVREKGGVKNGKAR